MAQRTSVCTDCRCIFDVLGKRGAMPRRCPECSQRNRTEYLARYRAANRERRNAYSRRWNAENAERKAANDARWRAAHPEYMERLRAANLVRVKQWIADNPEWAAELKRRRQSVRRARALGVGDAAPFRDLDIFERDGWVCQLCTERVERERKWPDPWSPSLDHVVPLSRGGAHTPNNTQLAHLGCNVRKGARIT